MIADIFRDVLKHTYNTGYMELVKLCGTDEGLIIEAMDPERSMVLTGVIPQTIVKLDGVIGLSRMQILKGFLGHDSFNQDDSSVSIATKQKGEYAVPAELHFTSGGGRVAASYRFMSAEIAEDQIQIPPFKGAAWGVEITPSTLSMKEFSTVHSILGPYEETFVVKTVGQNLEFYVGSEASSQAKIVFAENIRGKLDHAWAWPLSQVMSLFKLYDTSKSFDMAFSSSGALKITVNSGMGVYEYILSARSQQ